MRQQQEQMEQRNREVASQELVNEEERENIRAEQQAQAEARRRIEAEEARLAQNIIMASTTVQVPAFWTHKTGFHLQPTGFVFHQSRVGSTLTANFLGSDPQNLVFSESAPPAAAVLHCDRCSDERRIYVLRVSVY